MCSLRTHLRATALIFCLAPSGAAWAADGLADDPLYLFATCTGRLSALMEHQWIVDGPASDRTRQDRDAMLTLVEAAMRQGAEVQVMAWRIEAKVAHAALLAQSRSLDVAQAKRAERRAGLLMRDCSAITS
jgi:hypothetical protein